MNVLNKIGDKGQPCQTHLGELEIHKIDDY